MSDSPLVSIVLPTYNGSRYLRESLDSCLAQTYQNWELIVIDDCSTDATPQILSEYAAKDPRIRVHRNVKNLKLPASLNAGFDLTKGKVVSWTSDDNAYRPEAIARMSAFLQAHPDVGVVYTDYSVIDDDGKVIGYMKVDEAVALVHRSCVGACFLYRREVHEKLGGYDTNLFLVEDYDFWIRSSKSFKLATIHEDLYLYRRHGGSLTAQKEDRILEATASLIRTHLPQMQWVDRHNLSLAHLKLTMIALHFGKRGQAWNEFTTALRYRPQNLFRRGQLPMFTELIFGKKLFHALARGYRGLKSIVRK